MRCLVAVLAMLFSLIASVPARAEGRDVKKREISPFVGFETGGSYPVTNSFTVDRLRVDSGASYGAFVDYSLTENTQAEFMCSRNNTSFTAHDITTNSSSTPFDSDVHHFHLAFLS